MQTSFGFFNNPCDAHRQIATVECGLEQGYAPRMSGENTVAVVHRGSQTAAFVAEAALIANDKKKEAEAVSRVRRGLGVVLTGKDPEVEIAKAKQATASIVPWVVIGGLGVLYLFTRRRK